MFAIKVTEKGGNEQHLDFDKSEITIGRVKGNDIVLSKGNVSKRHARIVLKDGKYIVVDLKSTNGTYVNGRKITSPLVVKQTDKIYIGDFILNIDDKEPEIPVSDRKTGPTDESPPNISDSVRRKKSTSMPPMAPPKPSVSEPAKDPLAFLDNDPMPPIGAPPMGAPPERGATAALGGEKAHKPLMEVSPSRQPSSPTARQPDFLSPSSSPDPLSAPLPSMKSSPEMSPPPKFDALSEPGKIAWGISPKTQKQLNVQHELLTKLDEQIQILSLRMDELGDESIWRKAEERVVSLADDFEKNGRLEGIEDKDILIKSALDEALGLGPLEDLLADESVLEIYIDKRDRIAKKQGQNLVSTNTGFSSDESLKRVVQRILAPSGAIISEKNPIARTVMGDGTQVIATFPPVAVMGACVTLLKPKRTQAQINDLVADGSMSPQMGTFLGITMRARKNILISGSPSSGKNRILSGLANSISNDERTVILDGVGDLDLTQSNFIALESGLSTTSHRGALIENALSMRPSRLVVADLRGEEALPLVQALSTQVDGSIISVGSTNAIQALNYTATLCQLAASNANQMAVNKLVANSIDIVVQVSKYKSGQIVIDAVHEVMDVNLDGFSTREIFSYEFEDGFQSTGVVPRFYADLADKGIHADSTIFSS